MPHQMLDQSYEVCVRIRDGKAPWQITMCGPTWLLADAWAQANWKSGKDVRVSLIQRTPPTGRATPPETRRLLRELVHAA